VLYALASFRVLTVPFIRTASFCFEYLLNSFSINKLIICGKVPGKNSHHNGLCWLVYLFGDE